MLVSCKTNLVSLWFRPVSLQDVSLSAIVRLPGTHPPMLQRRIYVRHDGVDDPGQVDDPGDQQDDNGA